MTGEQRPSEALADLGAKIFPDATVTIEVNDGPANRAISATTHAVRLLVMGLPAGSEPTERCPRCSQLAGAIGDIGLTVFFNPDREAWWCAECDLRAIDGQNAYEHVRTDLPLDAATLYDRLANRADRGQFVDPTSFAMALGSYHRGDVGRLLADFLFAIRRPEREHQARSPLAAGTDGEMADRLEVALAAGGFLIEPATVVGRVTLNR